MKRFRTEAVEKLTRGGRSPKRGKNQPIPAKEEDSRKSPGKGWDYHDGHWWPPGHPKNEQTASPSKGTKDKEPAAKAPKSSSEKPKAQAKNPDFESKHPRKGGKFAPKGTGTVTEGKREAAPRAKPSNPAERAKAVKQVARDVLHVLGYGGEDMAAAIKDFQSKAGLPATGAVDNNTLRAMKRKIAGVREKRQDEPEAKKTDEEKPEAKGSMQAKAPKKKDKGEAKGKLKRRKVVEEHYEVEKALDAVIEIGPLEAEVMKRFDPNQPRDPFGRWVDIGGMARHLADMATYEGSTIGPAAAYRGLPHGKEVRVKGKTSAGMVRVEDPKTGEWLGDLPEGSLDQKKGSHLATFNAYAPPEARSGDTKGPKPKKEGPIQPDSKWDMYHGGRKHLEDGKTRTKDEQMVHDILHPPEPKPSTRRDGRTKDEDMVHDIMTGRRHLASDTEAKAPSKEEIAALTPSQRADYQRRLKELDRLYPSISPTYHPPFTRKIYDLVRSGDTGHADQPLDPSLHPAPALSDMPRPRHLLGLAIAAGIGHHYGKKHAGRPTLGEIGSERNKAKRDAMVQARLNKKPFDGAAWDLENASARHHIAVDGPEHVAQLERIANDTQYPMDIRSRAQAALRRIRGVDEGWRTPTVQQRLNGNWLRVGSEGEEAGRRSGADGETQKWEERIDRLGLRYMENPADVKPGGWMKKGDGPRQVTLSKRTFTYTGAALLDRGNNIEPGRQVRITKLPMAPKPGTMGQFHIADAETGKFLGMASYGSLAPAMKYAHAETDKDGNYTGRVVDGPGRHLAAGPFAQQDFDAELAAIKVPKAPKGHGLNLEVKRQAIKQNPEEAERLRQRLSNEAPHIDEMYVRRNFPELQSKVEAYNRLRSVASTDQEIDTLADLAEQFKAYTERRSSEAGALARENTAAAGV